MMYYRYGGFRFDDYNTSWIGMAILILFAFLSIVLRLSFLFVAFPTMYVLFWGWTILDQNCEKFMLTEDAIITVKHGKKQMRYLPSELSIVVSYVDICPPFSRNVSVGNKTHILKDRYAVSILKNTPLTTILGDLHQIPISKYTTSTIQAVFDDHRYIYCFVCTDFTLIESIMHNRECLVIVPRSLQEKVPIQSASGALYIDAGY